MKELVKASLVGALALAALVVLLAGQSSRPDVADAATPGTTVPPLLSCPNVDGSPNNGVRVGDILAVVTAYFKDWPSTDYAYLFDLVEPYNPETNTGGLQRVSDILAVVSRYFEDCPAVDTEVAQATLWARANVPIVENDAALAAIGYVKGSTNVPGQGEHYVKLANWDGTFDPAAPEGLVYDSHRATEDGFGIGSCNDGIDNGGDGVKDSRQPIFNSNPDPDCDYFTLSAHLYVVDGDQVGWIEDYSSGPGGSCWDGIDNGGGDAIDAADPDCQQTDPGFSPPLDDVHIDPLCNTSPCSWNGGEGWHLHYRLCTVHIGTPYAFALPLGPGSDSADCKAIQNSGPGAGLGDWRFAYKVGWMGHLWNHVANANVVPDVNGTMNGRFADCYPDGADGWKSYNCPQ